MAITFKSVLSAARAILQSKTVTAGTSDITVQPDSGYDGLNEVIVEPTPSTAITPSNASPAAMTSGERYTPGANGYAIESYADVTPSSNGAAFSAGINKMSAAGYAYSARPSGGVLRTIATERKSNTVSNFTDSMNNVDCTGFSNYQNWSLDNFLICPQHGTTSGSYVGRSTTAYDTQALKLAARGTLMFSATYDAYSGKLKYYCYEEVTLMYQSSVRGTAAKTAIPCDIYYYES